MHTRPRRLLSLLETTKLSEEDQDKGSSTSVILPPSNKQQKQHRYRKVKLAH